ncbi:protease modulator HflK N-terminal domain-containing protein, partial [Salmonella enterica subsp. enterica serovar Kentucky]|nr:protease modulator HflK N-terminal domain-containing protein [Salmonella enterica subsp. enterica serovar Kentucky]
MSNFQTTRVSPLFQPGNNGQDRDPWGSSKPGSNSGGNGNKGGRDQGPPDLDDIFR